ncbi:hypothetical protein NIES2101_19405 [Calothrix sp. HK-06]|nr:hypothetical protein NIES2101_19405 [Calothrix sp. HK-06]
MNKRGAGITLIGISAFLFGARSLTAAHTIGRTVADEKTFENRTTVQEVRIFAVATGVAGLVYVIWGEVEARSSNQKNKL